ncbi:MAG: TonB-dependent receptor [Bacteroidota bacterium]
MNKFSFLFLFILLSVSSAFSQGATQTVKGTIIDKQSEIPLIGATVEFLGSAEMMGATTDIDGRFSIPNIPVGRQSFRVSYLGYNTITIPNVVVTSGKEVELEVALEESITKINEIVVTADAQKDRAQNELATVSARTFSLEEVNRYSGGRNDVSRLVSNYAGVSTADDSRNDIVIRGNSPTGVLWRLEGIPIPNPNHFATLGTTGGPVSALNTNLLKNSDFLTSAFPSEYGNALAGVFDLGFRNGNRDNYEFTLQLNAFSGLEAMAEGPLNKKKTASFVAAYRYSFVGFASAVGIPVGTNATPNYQDLSFKVDFGNSKIGKFSIFGIGGYSSIDFLGDEIDETDLFANPNEDAFPRSRLGIIGLRHNILLGENTYLRTVVSASQAQTIYDQFNIMSDGERLLETDADDRVNTYSFSTFVNSKLSSRLTLRTGLLAQMFHLNTIVRDRENLPDIDGDGIPDWVTLRDFEGDVPLLQPYVQTQFRVSDKFTINAGLHGQILTFNGSAIVEPRASVNWKPAQRHMFTLGYGLHSQVQPLPIFFLEIADENGNLVRSNEDLDFTKSHHLVLGYDYKPADDWRIKAEAYYQYILDVPVESVEGSFSMLNVGDDFIFPEEHFLVNAGTGANFGIELTIEKFFSKGYYGLLTTSVYQSKYKGSDNIQRNTAFNNQYVINLLAGKEFKVGSKKNNAITFDFKLTNAGGRNYTPVDLDASQMVGEEVLIEQEAYSLRYEPYFRLDAKVGFSMNSSKRKLSQQFFIDFENVTNRKNVFQKRYNEVTNEVNTVYQTGFFPDILYRIQF